MLLRQSCVGFELNVADVLQRITFYNAQPRSGRGRLPSLGATVMVHLSFCLYWRAYSIASLGVHRPRFHTTSRCGRFGQQ